MIPSRVPERPGHLTKYECGLWKRLLALRLDRSEPDQVETIAASYVQPGNSAKVRLFNLSPDTRVAGMASSANGSKPIATNVAFSLGSDWVNVPASSQTFTFTDDMTSKVLTTKTETPPAAPLGYTNILLGMQKQSSGASGSGLGMQVVPLQDAPEGGVCKPN